jgi:NADH pyrophosphatase NudC (nudix superfamily)
VTDVVVYPNGDTSQYLDLTFRMRWTSGEPHPADDENTDARWFPLDALPEMSAEMTGRIETALSDRSSARFRCSGEASES